MGLRYTTNILSTTDLYRQGPCPISTGKDCVQINKPWFQLNDLPSDSTVANFLPGMWGDNIMGWWSDFFYPTLELLQSAPLIAIRGNHETCLRGGHGWFLFLSQDDYPSDTIAGTYCNDYSEPYAVSFQEEQFLVLDDSIIQPKNGGIDHLLFSKLFCYEIASILSINRSL